LALAARGVGRADRHSGVDDSPVSVDGREWDPAHN
jgi:hypothetical protein